MPTGNSSESALATGFTEAVQIHNDFGSQPSQPQRGDTSSVSALQSAFQGALSQGAYAYAEDRERELVERYRVLTDPSRPKFGEPVQLGGITYDSHLEASYALVGCDHNWNLNREPLEVNGSRPDFLRGVARPDLIEIKGEDTPQQLLQYIPKLQAVGWTNRAMILGDFFQPVHSDAWAIGIGADCCQWQPQYWSSAVVYACRGCGLFDLTVQTDRPLPTVCQRCESVTPIGFAKPYRWDDTIRQAKYTVAKIAEEQGRAAAVQRLGQPTIGYVQS